MTTFLEIGGFRYIVNELSENARNGSTPSASTASSGAKRRVDRAVDDDDDDVDDKLNADEDGGDDATDNHQLSLVMCTISGSSGGGSGGGGSSGFVLEFDCDRALFPVLAKEKARLEDESGAQLLLPTATERDSTKIKLSHAKDKSRVAALKLGWVRCFVMFYCKQTHKFSLRC